MSPAGILLLLASQSANPGAMARIAHAESLLAAGDLQQARRVVEPIANRNPRNFRAVMLLGKIHLEWPVIGRYRAWKLFRNAAHLEPSNPEPRYQQMRVGLFLEGDDGERMARDAIFRIWKIDPFYRDTWEIWNRMYRGRGHYNRAIATLAEDAGDPVADIRRAQMLIELAEFDRARLLIDTLIALGRDDAAVWALAAEAALIGFDAQTGAQYYEMAIQRAESDSLHLLWDQISTITSPEEDSTYWSLDSSQRYEFYRVFWERREPDLTRAGNERIPEHFNRLGEARRLYHLKHPMAMFHTSASWRTVLSAGNQNVAQIAREFDPRTSRFGRTSIAFPDTLSLPLVDSRDVTQPGELTRYSRFGFDGRGLVYLRFGNPRRLLTTFGTGQGAGLEGDVERWFYSSPDGEISVTFAQRAGDMVLNPITRSEQAIIQTLLENDEASIRTTTEMKAWVATFRSHNADSTDVYVRTDPESTTVALWDESWNQLTTTTGVGMHVVTVTPGIRNVGIDYRSGEDFASVRGKTTIPWFALGQLGISSIVIGLASDSAVGREASALSMPVDLKFPVDSTVKLYTEIYDLSAEGGTARYRVEYTFQMVRDDERVRFAFTRLVPHRETVVEELIVAPGRIPRGRYDIVLRVRDVVSQNEIVISRLNVEFH